jgi:nardilysin
MMFKEFIFKFLKSLKFKVLIQGNFKKSQALEITKNILKNFNDEGLTFKKMKVGSTNKLPIGNVYLRVKSLLPNDKNSVIKNYYQIGEATSESECLLELVVKIMREPLFNHIRTREQLGYSVSCSSKKDDNILGLSITVESQEKRNSSWIVDSKVENFLKDFSRLLSEVNEEDFEMMKRSIISHKRSNETDLESDVNKNWIEIRESKYHFERNDIEARQMAILKKEDLKIFFIENFLSSNVRKLSTHVIANADDGNDSLVQHGFLHLDLITDEKHNTIKNIAHFKNSLMAWSRL